MSARSGDITMTRALRRTIRKLGVLAAHLGTTRPAAMDVALNEALASRQIPFGSDADLLQSKDRKRKAV